MKAMEKDRKSNGLEGWDNLSGEGSKCKERKLLLQFLSSGKLEQAAVSQETRGLNSATQKKSNEWCSWHAVCQVYGEEEAKLRVQKGLVKWRKDPEAQSKGVTLHQFLMVKNKTDFKQGIEQETKATKKPKPAADKWLSWGPA